MQEMDKYKIPGIVKIVPVPEHAPIKMSEKDMLEYRKRKKRLSQVKAARHWPVRQTIVK